MRILILGAGGIGGYFGARIQAAGGDITFLVRPARAAQLRAGGLKIFSAFGDLQITPEVLTADELRTPFDVIIVSCKAYDLDSAMDSIAPAVGDHSVILPLLNGVSHIDTLAARFGSQKVLGGVALISCRSRHAGEKEDEFPLPLDREEIDGFIRAGLREDAFKAYDDDQAPPVPHFFACYSRPN